MSKEQKTEPWVHTKGMGDPVLSVGVIAHITQNPGAMTQRPLSCCSFAGCLAWALCDYSFLTAL